MIDAHMAGSAVLILVVLLLVVGVGAAFLMMSGGSSAPATTEVKIGPDVVARSEVDGVNGMVFVYDGVSLAKIKGKKIKQLSIYTLPASIGKTLTPLLLQASGEGKYKIVAICEPQTISESGEVTIDWVTEEGEDVIKGGYILGWRDGSKSTGNTGVIAMDYKNGGLPVKFANALSYIGAGTEVTKAGEGNRLYSIRITKVE